MYNWEDDDEGPDPEYGVFGDKGMEQAPPLPMSAMDRKRVAIQRKREEQTARASREFNSYMIELFNSQNR